MTLVLPADRREAVVDHALAGAPEEVVGVLGGERGDDVSTVDRRYPAENAASTPETRYEIDPVEELELLERVDESGLDVVGFYHSHPQGPLAPSETDVRLASWPRYSYVIVSLAGGETELGSWRWTGESFERETIEVR